MSGINEQVQFRLFQMPCCKFQLCWVNPRVPSYCPECGKPAFMVLRDESHTLVCSPAWLKIKDYHEKVAMGET